MYFFFVFSSLVPTIFKISKKFFDEPSIIGISSLLTSIIALSIPNIDKAAKRCSTVETLT